jgi:hypothetical protein
VLEEMPDVDYADIEGLARQIGASVSEPERVAHFRRKRPFLGLKMVANICSASSNSGESCT